MISTPDERLPLLKGHFSGEKGVASQEGFPCIAVYKFVYRWLMCVCMCQRVDNCDFT